MTVVAAPGPTTTITQPGTSTTTAAPAPTTTTTGLATTATTERPVGLLDHPTTRRDLTHARSRPEPSRTPVRRGTKVPAIVTTATAQQTTTTTGLARTGSPIAGMLVMALIALTFGSMAVRFRKAERSYKR